MGGGAWSGATGLFCCRTWAEQRAAGRRDAGKFKASATKLPSLHNHRRPHHPYLSAMATDMKPRVLRKGKQLQLWYFCIFPQCV